MVHASAPPSAAAEPAPAASAGAPAGSTVTTTELALPASAKKAVPPPAAAAEKRTAPEPAPAPDMALREPSDVSVVHAQPAAVAPPTLTLEASAAPSLPRPSSAMPMVQPRVSGGITEAKLIHRVDPVYPAVARQMHVEGNVEIRAVVSREGTIKNPVAVSGPALLRSAALEAIRKWRYEPSRLDGQATDRDVLITIAFHLPK